MRIIGFTEKKNSQSYGSDMDERSKSDADNLIDVTPFLKLLIDKDGRWFQNGAEIIHPEIYKYFSASLEKTSVGEYRIRINNEVCRVEVEDAPFVVQSITETQKDKIYLRLNDSSEEPLNPEWFWIGKDNIPYCLIKEARFHARFSRPAYYALTNYIIASPDQQRFFLQLNGQSTLIETCRPELRI